MRVVRVVRAGSSPGTEDQGVGVTRSTLSPAPLSVVTRSEPSGVGVTDRKRPNWFSNPKVCASTERPSALRRRKISSLL